MNSDSSYLLQFKSNVHSQGGEDGVLQKVLEILPEHDKWCVEFGAHDGIFASNTRNLIENCAYSAVLIEGSKARFTKLRKNYSGKENVIAVNQFVGFTENDNLDHILRKTPVPRNFDFLSIDIDGNDYHAWKACSEYTPKVVCIEFNPTIPTEIQFVQKSDPSVNQGSSLRSLVELGKSKGYELVSVLTANAIFVKAEHYRLFEIDDNRPEALRKNLDKITYMFVGFDGTIHLSGNQKLPWHSMEIKESKIQQLPRRLRKYPENYTKFEKVLFRAYLRPGDIPKIAIEFIKRHCT